MGGWGFFGSFDSFWSHIVGRLFLRIEHRNPNEDDGEIKNPHPLVDPIAEINKAEMGGCPRPKGYERIDFYWQRYASLSEEVALKDNGEPEHPTDPRKDAVELPVIVRGVSIDIPDDGSRQDVEGDEGAKEEEG